MASSTLAVIDAQGFRSNTNELIFKELSILSLDGKISQTYLFEPPANLQQSFRTNTWLTNNHHGLKWSDGNTPYHHVESIFSEINLKFDKFFVKGVEKRLWLWQYLSKEMENVEERGCPALHKLKGGRFCLKNHSVCSLNNAEKIRKFILLHLDEDDAFFSCSSSGISKGEDISEDFHYYSF